MAFFSLRTVVRTRVAYFSDLHLEFSSLDLDMGSADLVIAAGDLFAPADRLVEPNALHPGILWLDDRIQDRPVLVVPGNHDYEGTRFPDALAAMRRAAEGTAIRVLWNETFDYRGIRYLGTPLWSDPRKPGQDWEELARFLNLVSDLPRARDENGRPLNVEWLLAQHAQARAFLSAELARDLDVPKVVITHWAPSALSQSPAWRANPKSNYWASPNEDLVEQAMVWFHGHVHETAHYRVGNHPSRGLVLSNPRGTSRLFNQASNPRFRQPALVTLSSDGNAVPEE